MQIYVRQYWAGTVSLRRTPFLVEIFSLLHDTGFQEPPDKVQELPVRYVMLQHLHQVLMVYRVKERTYVRLDHKVGMAVLHRFDYFPYSHMAVSPGSEPVTAPIEFRLIDRR